MAIAFRAFGLPIDDLRPCLDQIGYPYVHLERYNRVRLTVDVALQAVAVQSLAPTFTKDSDDLGRFAWRENFFIEDRVRATTVAFNASYADDFFALVSYLEGSTSFLFIRPHFDAHLSLIPDQGRRV